jgi:FkbM family methyltransferase
MQQTIRKMIRKLLGPNQGIYASAQQKASEFSFDAKQVTEQDIQYCFRLFMQRAPRPDEFAYWKNQLNSPQMKLETLIDEFGNSKEFLERQQVTQHIELVELPFFNIYVRPSDFSVGANIAATKTYEPEVTELFQEIVQPGCYILDIGANIGYFTLLAAARVGEAGKVFAVEPNIKNCELIQQSAKANNFANIEIYPVAAAEQPQIFVLDTAGSGSNGRIIDATPEAVPGNTPPRIIQAVKIDDMLSQIPRLDVVKMDIEGAEPRALLGMRDLIQRYRPLIITEFSPFLIQVTSHTTPEAYLEQLHTLDYQIKVIGEAATDPGIPEIMQMYYARGASHLDLLAVPRMERG